MCNITKCTSDIYTGGIVLKAGGQSLKLTLDSVLNVFLRSLSPLFGLLTPEQCTFCLHSVAFWLCALSSVNSHWRCAAGLPGSWIHKTEEFLLFLSKMMSLSSFILSLFGFKTSHLLTLGPALMPACHFSTVKYNVQNESFIFLLIWLRSLLEAVSKKSQALPGMHYKWFIQP